MSTNSGENGSEHTEIGDEIRRLDAAFVDQIGQGAVAAAIKMDTENLLLTTTDARVWAVEFMHLWGEHRDQIDLDLMISWFANAIETGRKTGEAAVRG